MPVDISERLSEIIPILSFLRVLRSDHRKPGQCVGLFVFLTAISEMAFGWYAKCLLAMIRPIANHKERRSGCRIEARYKIQSQAPQAR